MLNSFNIAFCPFPEIDKMDAVALAKHVAARSAQVFRESGEVHPTFLFHCTLEGASGLALFLPERWCPDEDTAATVVRSLAKALNATRVVTTMECMVIFQPTEDEKRLADAHGVLRSGLPFDEMILTTVEDRERVTSIEQRIIVSVVDGSKTLDDPRVDEDGKRNLEGRFVGLLQESAS